MQSLRRVTICFELAAQHFRLMETMRTQDYLTFRDKLNPASGFQSAQMREIEVLIGLPDDDRIPFGKEGSYLDALKSHDGSPSPAYERVERRIADTPTLKTAVQTPGCSARRSAAALPGDADDDQVVRDWIEQFFAGHEKLYERALEHAVATQALTGPDEERLRACATAASSTGRAAPHRRRRRASRATAVRGCDACARRSCSSTATARLPLLSWPGSVIDGLIECEQAMLAFRQRHARMVERVIGRRVGTGGSDGVAYLDQTALNYRVFTEIWAARTLLLPPDLSPEVRNREYYGLASD